MSGPIKQLVLVRRRSGQSVQQFLDYHYQQHGRHSQAPTPEETPLVYFQTHFFDSIYSSATPAQPLWSGHNDAAELYFSDMAHLGRVFGSKHVREVVGPDGKNFNDFAATIAMFTYEELISGSEPLEQGDEQVLVASWWVQSRDPKKDLKDFATELKPLVVGAFGDISRKVVVNVALPDEAGMLKYFTGDIAPSYSACYQVYLTDKAQVADFLDKKATLEERAAELVVQETTFATFGIRSVVLDQTRGVRFDASRQPRLP